MRFNPYTPWFDGLTDPVRPGRYQVQLFGIASRRYERVIRWAHWDGKRWNDKSVCYVKDRWRGLNKSYRLS